MPDQDCEIWLLFLYPFLMSALSPDFKQFEAAVVGGGPAGLVSAIGLAQSGVKTALLAKRLPYADNRTTALLGRSVEWLESLDVWQRCATHAAALRVMRLVDDTNRLFRAPEVRFSSEEIGRDAFGYNIENRALMAALDQRASEFSNLTWLDDEALAIELQSDAVILKTRRDQQLSAQLIVGADGRHSICRDAAGISTTRRSLDQVAITFNIAHTRSHDNISTEFHTTHGPCVFVPLPGERSSVVWVTKPEEARRLASLSNDELASVVERKSHSILGRVKVEEGRNTFQLSIEKPARFAANRIILVGESAHVLPPIGAQGLNMGLRDAADMVDVVADAISKRKDPGASEILSRYERARALDINSRSFVIDWANRSLLSDFLPLQAMRALGLHAAGALGPLRRFAMREGLAPSWR